MKQEVQLVDVRQFQSKKNGKTYSIVTLYDGMYTSKDFFITLTPEQYEHLQQLTKGQTVEAEFQSDPFVDDRIFLKAIHTS